MKGNALERAWKTAVSSLDPSSLSPSQMSFIHRAQPLGDIEGTILVSVVDEFSKMYIEKHAMKQLTAALTEVLGRETRIAVTVDPSTKVPALPEEEEDDIPKPSPSWGQSGASAVSAAPWELKPTTSSPNASKRSLDLSPTVIDGIDLSGTRLNPSFTFDTFVIGSSNRFASAAATAVAEMPAKSYNPLFIYGDSGLGKTHLLHAIGNYVVSFYPHMKVKYVSSEEFTNDFINSIRDDRPEQFQQRYRRVDVLLIDDIQFIQGKEQTVEEFFHTFNTLYNANKQVVITSDVPPKQLSGFEDRMRSRFEMGLLTDIQPPDLETRIAILRKKAIAENLAIDDNILEYIASRISSNIRELEGSLLRVTAYANITRQMLDRPLAEMVLKDIISDPEDCEITVATIMGQTADYFDFTVEQLCSQDRSRQLVEARQIAMYLCRELTDLSLPKIGQAFGGRDHTTVIYANKRISEFITQKPEIYKHVTELTSRIKQQARQK